KAMRSFLLAAALVAPVVVALPRVASACDPPNWAGTSAADPDANTTYATFHSDIVGADVGYRVSLPADYDASSDAYNVLYLCHGGGGNLLTMSYFVAKLREAADGGQAPKNVITVSINGLASMYVDSAPGALYDVPMESVIIQELVPHIDATYRTLGTRA